MEAGRHRPAERAKAPYIYLRKKDAATPTAVQPTPLTKSRVAIPSILSQLTASFRAGMLPSLWARCADITRSYQRSRRLAMGKLTSLGNPGLVLIT